MNILAGCLHGSVPHICHQQREYCIRVFAMRCQLLQTVYAKCVSQVMQPRTFSLAAVWNASPERMSLNVVSIVARLYLEPSGEGKKYSSFLRNPICSLYAIKRALKLSSSGMRRSRLVLCFAGERNHPRNEHHPQLDSTPQKCGVRKSIGHGTTKDRRYGASGCTC